MTKECYASKGQPIEKEVVCELADDGISWKLTFKAGRHGSDEAADKFIKYITADGKMTGASIGCKTMVTHPDKLNFAFLGDLYIRDKNDKYECVGKDIVFAQGHNSKDNNNWWIGGRNMVNLFDAKILKGVEQNFTKDILETEAVLTCLCTFMPYLSESNRFSITKISL